LSSFEDPHRMLESSFFVFLLSRARSLSGSAFHSASEGLIVRRFPAAPPHEFQAVPFFSGSNRYAAHVSAASAALAPHPCALVLDIASPTAGAQLAAAFNGTRAECWSQRNAARSPSARVPSAASEPSPREGPGASGQGGGSRVLGGGMAGSGYSGGLQPRSAFRRERREH
jgi:hypothetical protein